MIVMFADMKAAFDKLKREEIWKRLERKGVSRHLIGRMKELFKNTKGLR